MIDKSIEEGFIEKLRKRLEKEGVDITLLTRGKVFEDEVDYNLGDLGLAIFPDLELPQFHIFWETPLGMKYLPYEKWSFKNLDEQTNVVIDDFIMYYKDPEKRENFILKNINKIFSKLKGGNEDQR